MKQIVNMVAQKAGISESQAQTAVETVASFIKDKLPAGMASQVDSYLSGSEEGAAGDGSGSIASKMKGFTDKAGGIFGKDQ